MDSDASSIGMPMQSTMSASAIATWPIEHYKDAPDRPSTRAFQHTPPCSELGASRRLKRRAKLNCQVVVKGPAGAMHARCCPQDLPSRGSKNHHAGLCRPCRAVSAVGGCPDGQSCNFCHFQHGPGTIISVDTCAAETESELEMGKLEDLPSRGSKNHYSGKCRPCHAFVSVGGCPHGSQCNFCHLQHVSRSIRCGEDFATEIECTSPLGLELQFWSLPEWDCNFDGWSCNFGHCHNGTGAIAEFECERTMGELKDLLQMPTAR